MRKILATILCQFMHCLLYATNFLLFSDWVLYILNKLCNVTPCCLVDHMYFMEMLQMTSLGIAILPTKHYMYFCGCSLLCSLLTCVLLRLNILLTLCSLHSPLSPSPTCVLFWLLQMYQREACEPFCNFSSASLTINLKVAWSFPFLCVAFVLRCCPNLAASTYSR